MKNRIFIAGLGVMLVAFTACQNKEEMQAKKNVDNYSSYVDSISKVDMAEAKANWDAISARYEQQMADAEASMEMMKDKAEAQAHIDSAKAKYENMKGKIMADMEAEKAKMAENDRPAKLRTEFFNGKMTSDNYDWVNKDNILSVYQGFTENFYKNKDSYNREDYDKIKAMYEALDSRKNTVEKEGLSTVDNLKIATIKTKFATLFKVDRIGAKAAENSQAKDEAAK